jgi:hypothetical protein
VADLQKVNVWKCGYVFIYEYRMHEKMMDHSRSVPDRCTLKAAEEIRCSEKFKFRIVMKNIETNLSTVYGPKKIFFD